MARRSGNAHFKVTDYAPCPKCEEWIILEKSINYHQKSCPASQSSNEVFHKGATILSVCFSWQDKLERILNSAEGGYTMHEKGRCWENHHT